MTDHLQVAKNALQPTLDGTFMTPAQHTVQYTAAIAHALVALIEEIREVRREANEDLR